MEEEEEEEEVETGVKHEFLKKETMKFEPSKSIIILLRK